MKWQSILLIAVSTILISCFHDGNDDVNYFVQGPGPTLTAADKSTVTPCPNQDILVDATELTSLKDALSTGTLSFLDVPFDGSDVDNFKKKCGFDSGTQNFWDPANNTNEVPQASIGGTITISNLLENGNAGICTANSTPMNFFTGFPVAGTYRGEIKAAKGVFTWHLRYRAVASGSSAGNTFLAESITVPGDVENTLEYKINGVVKAHADVFTAIVNAMTTTADPIVLDVSKTAGGTTVFSLSIEVICVTKS